MRQSLSRLQQCLSEEGLLFGFQFWSCVDDSGSEEFDQRLQRDFPTHRTRPSGH